jgi:type I restriction enzyme S subunit
MADRKMDDGKLQFEREPEMTSGISAGELHDRLDAQPYRSHLLSLHKALLKANSARLGKIADVSGGDPVPSDEFRQQGVPLVRIRDIEPDGFSPPDVCVSESYAHSRTGCEARNLRVVLGMDGEFRAQFFLHPDLPRFINQRVAIVDCTRIRSELLTAWLNRPEGKLQLARWAVQTTVAHTSLSHIRNLLIPRLSADDENWIADCLLHAREAKLEAQQLVTQARTAVESLIDGTLDEPALLAEGEAIEHWLAAHPSPRKDTQ